MKEYLGKIESARFGIAGYQDACIGLHLTFSFDKCGGVATSVDTWDPSTVECSEYCDWTEEDRDKNLADIMRKLSSTLKDAKVRDVAELKGKPVMLTFGGSGGIGSQLEDWRILTEVL